jgi:hypothetical protein
MKTGATRFFFVTAGLGRSATRCTNRLNHLNCLNQNRVNLNRLNLNRFYRLDRTNGTNAPFTRGPRTSFPRRREPKFDALR